MAAHSEGRSQRSNSPSWGGQGERRSADLVVHPGIATLAVDQEGVGEIGKLSPNTVKGYMALGGGG
jgi:hypothetical protein